MSLEKQAIAVVLFSPLVAAGLMMLSGNSVAVLGFPAYAVCVAWIFLLQWVVFVPSYLSQTEKFFDLTGSATFISVALLAIVIGAEGDPRSLLLGALVIIWAVRLGSFLFARIHRKGSDSRFRTIVPSFWIFLMTWTLQAFWVSITSSAALLAMTSPIKLPLDGWALAGLLVWIVGFGVEVTADRQKQAFRARPENVDRFISTGLWSRSRHPNYFGEILLWAGVAIIAVPVLVGWQVLSLMSPVFILILLTRISGVQMLERQAESRWGADPEYQAYKARTRPLLPLPTLRAPPQTAAQG